MSRRDRKERRKNRRREAKGIDFREILMKVLLVICILIFLVSALQLYKIYKEYKDGNDIYDSLIEEYLETPDESTGEAVDEELSLNYNDFYVNFDMLQASNPDIVAWIRFDEPSIINYPVVQASDNSTYLTTAFTGEYSSLGTIFIDKENSADFSDDNTIIYGHNMKDGSMFGDLSEYIEEEFYLEYPYFYIYTPDGMASKYQVAVVSEVYATDSYRYSKNFSSAIEFSEYILDIFKVSYYDTLAQVDASDTLITLSTCTASDEKRFIVQAVKVEELPFE